MATRQKSKRTKIFLDLPTLQSLIVHVGIHTNGLKCRWQCYLPIYLIIMSKWLLYKIWYLWSFGRNLTMLAQIYDYLPFYESTTTALKYTFTFIVSHAVTHRLYKISLSNSWLNMYNVAVTQKCTLFCQRTYIQRLYKCNKFRCVTSSVVQGLASVAFTH